MTSTAASESNPAEIRKLVQREQLLSRMALVLMWLFLLSPMMLQPLLNNGRGRIDILYCLNLITTVLWVGTLHFSIRRPVVLHALVAPLYITTAIDLFQMATFGNRLTSGYIGVAITNSEEVGEFFGAYGRPILASLAMAAVVYGLGMFGVRKIVLKPRGRWSIACASLLLALYTALTTPAIWTVPTLKEMVLDVFGKEMSAPMGSVFQLGLAVQILNDESELKRQRAQNSLGARPSRSNKNEIYVWVVGESSRPENWSLFHYNRDTSPRARSNPNIIPLSNVYSTSPLTSFAVPSMLSLWPITDWKSIVAHRSIVSAFNEAGFSTYWLSTQEADTWGGVIPQLATEAKRRWYFDRAFDGAMLERFRTLLDSAAEGEKIFIVIHTKGSHFVYSRRHPADFAKFKNSTESRRNNLVDMYDNTILYTDWFVGEVVQMLNERGGPSALMYASDHGENLLDDDRQLLGHGIGSDFDLRSAAFLWLSDPLRNKMTEMSRTAKENASAKLNLSNLPHSFLDLAGIEAAQLDSSLSIFSPNFKERERWHLIEGKLFSEDEIFKNQTRKPKVAGHEPH